MLSPYYSIQPSQIGFFLLVIMHLKLFHVFIYSSWYSSSPIRVHLLKGILVASTFWQLWISCYKRLVAGFCGDVSFQAETLKITTLRCKEILTTWDLGLFYVSYLHLYWSWCQEARIIVVIAPLMEAFFATCIFFLGWRWLGCSLHQEAGVELKCFLAACSSLLPPPGLLSCLQIQVKAFYHWDNSHCGVLMCIMLRLAFSISSPHLPSPAPTVVCTSMSISICIHIYFPY